MLWRTIALGLTFAFGANLTLAQAAPSTKPVPASGEAISDSDLGTNIIAASVADGKLWLVGHSRDVKRKNNALVSFSLVNGERVLRYPDGVVAMAKIARQLWVLRSTATDGAFELLSWKNDGFESAGEFSVGKDERIMALTSLSDLPVIISTTTVRTKSDKGWEIAAIHPVFNDGFGFGVPTAGVPTSEKAIYVGLNRGEWGGGLLTIGPSNGALKPVESDQKSDGGFGTVLNALLDPVNAIIADPQNPDCIIAAVGLVHFMASGRILRVCNNKVSVVFEHLIPEDTNGHHYNMSDAFFGLVPSADGYWAVSTGGIYHFQKSDNPEHIGIPKLSMWHGLWLTRDVPGVIVLSTDMNQTFSISGYTPLIVSLDEN
jgi:hypothetical protein